ncbi:hypothetical protein [Streptomyces cyaneofuscatus]|uniref:hypothetical protein n=1 Tax=Streptomyces cyaneofuscatus TaxID=66883 RepID=UPI0033B008F7
MATSSSPTTDAPAGDAFHTPPIPLPDGAPGDPIHARPLDNPAAAVPGGENWLVLHRSEGADGGPVATSGTIALPDRTAHPVPADEPLGSPSGSRLS